MSYVDDVDDVDEKDIELLLGDIYLNNDDNDEESRKYFFYDEDDDDDDTKRNTKNHSLPSVEEAQFYAARILSANANREIYGRGEKISAEDSSPRLPGIIARNESEESRPGAWAIPGPQLMRQHRITLPMEPQNLIEARIVEEEPPSLVFEASLLQKGKNWKWIFAMAFLIFLLTMAIAGIFIQESHRRKNLAENRDGINTFIPSSFPSFLPTVGEIIEQPTLNPTNQPTVVLTQEPTVFPTQEPTVFPTQEPTVFPTLEPTVFPTIEPTVNPTEIPTSRPSFEATLEEEILKEEMPSEEESIQKAPALSSEQTGTEIEEPTTDSLLTKICPNDNNFQDMYKYLNSTTPADDGNAIYMIEMLKFHDESLYDEYINDLVQKILPNINGAKIVFRMKNPITPITATSTAATTATDNNRDHATTRATTSSTNNDLQEWDEIVIIQYPTKERYLNGVLMENSGLEGFDNTDYNTTKELLEKRTIALQQSSVWIASLNQDMKINYPGLVVNEKNYFNSIDNDNLMIHGYKYKEYNTNQENNIIAKNIISIYDLITENVKTNNDMYTLGWFDIHASCSSNNDDTNLDQIRIETMGNYPAAIINPDWYQGLQYLYQGIDKDHSLSTFATQSTITNLYEK